MMRYLAAIGAALRAGYTLDDAAAIARCYALNTNEGAPNA
jgi:hypothetical protein